MDWKRKLTMTTVAAATAFSLFSSAVLAAPEDTDGEGNAAEEEQAAAPEASVEEETAVSQESKEATAQTLSPEEALELYQTKGVKYTSQRYGYSIICPKKPNVIPASLLVEGAKGDVLIFENDGYDIKNAWVVLADAFDDAELPADMGQKSEDEQKAYIDHLMNTAGYEFVRLTQVAGGTGVYAVTAKEIDVDTDGDGKPDDTMVAENQGIKTFFRGQYGGHFSVQLIDNPELSPAGVSLYQLGLLTFQEWPTAVEDGKVVQKDKDAKPTDNKKDKKDKKNKK
ncbi:MAG: hypothetical protein ACFNUI_08450 [Negativicutes bacterium]